MFNLKTLIVTVIGCGAVLLAAAQNKRQLVPDKPSAAPDYFCTWSVQGYAVSYQGAAPTREAMNEAYLFGDGKFQGWANFYPSIRQDLFFVMDDSWDIPQQANDVPNPYLGMAELSESRFPSFKGSPEERLKQLTERLEGMGWKGVGGWICAQKADNYANEDESAYWAKRLKAAETAGFDYWKVDWGRNDKSAEWRKNLTDMGHAYAPNLWIEHALDNRFVTFSDVYRTYDVENITAQPVTIERICNLLPHRAVSPAKGIINCEDEPYIAAGLGCAIGIMRYPFAGNLPDGTQDITFPPVGRDIKRRVDEVVRGVRWHRLALPFGVDGKSFAIDSARLEDHWVLGENETWVRTRKAGEIMTASAPARVSRNMPLPQVSDSTSADRPFVLCSRYPNGATAVSSIGRALNREYVSKKIGVTLPIESVEAPIGVFGYFEEVTLLFDEGLNMQEYEVYAQDLAGNTSVDITGQVHIEGNAVTFPGELLERVGLSAATENDCSDPGLVIRFFGKKGLPVKAEKDMAKGL